MNNNKNVAVGIASACAILAGIFWGSEGTFVRFLMDYGLDNVSIIGTRLSLASLIILVMILVYDRSLLRISAKDILILVLTGLAGSVGLNYCYNEAIDRMTLSLAAVLLDLCPVYMILIAYFAFGEKITRRKILCLGMAIAGVILLSGLGTDKPVWTGLGVFFGLVSGFCYAAYGLLSKEAANRGCRPLTLNFYPILTAAVATAPFTDWQKAGEVIVQHGVKACIILVLNALCCAILPYIMFAYALTKMDAGRAGILAIGEPAAAMVLGIIFFREIPTGLMVLGMAMIIAALAVLNLPERAPLSRRSRRDEV
ncbi:MAG: DMT family transporter [Anaerovoracaceae bacterium]|nr:DMT family transporter [Bacillota bacterium]MDY2671265.1 DMT family transporter [Anaerovoracaceae bacterium]